MLAISERRKGEYGEMWLTHIDMAKRRWLFMELPYRVLHDDLKSRTTSGLQSESDLDLLTLPQYACRVPAAIFFPFLTYVVGEWFGVPFGPTFVIPNEPLNRVESRYWLSTLARHPTYLVSKNPEGLSHGWIKSDGTAIVGEGWPLSYLDLVRLSAGAQSFFLDDIRYVYDENKRSSDSTKTNTPTRHQFGIDTVTFAATAAYLEWYIQQFNSFFDRLVDLGKNADAEQREKCLVAGWTVNRLAVDVLTISHTDAPYIRKWQFFGFLDAAAALINELDGTGHKQSKDRETAKTILGKDFLKNDLLPVLEELPVASIRDELIAHTQAQYDAIEKMAQKEKSGPEILWLYRTTRHGYTLNRDDDRGLLLRSSGAIPNDLPDLAAALWHYILVRFPFK